MKIKDLGNPIARSTNLYPWGEKQILKVYDTDVPRQFVIELGHKEKALFDAGLPVPEVGELIEIEDCLGQVYERIEGRTFADEMLTISDPEAENLLKRAYEFAEAQAKIHLAQDVDVELLTQKELFPEVLERIAVLPAELKEAVLALLATMPDGDRICHGDFHPFNLIQGPHGTIVIDWNNSHQGDPLEDVARTSLMIEGFGRMMPEIDTVVARFNEVYLAHYFELTDAKHSQMKRWWPIVAAVRLVDEVTELEGWLLEQVRDGV